MEIQNFEHSLEEAFPKYSLTGSLEDKGELSIRHKGAACHVKIYAKRFLIYSYGGNIRNFRMIVPIIAFFLILPILIACIGWYLLDLYFQKDEKKIGKELEQFIKENNVDFERYDPPKW